MAAAATLQANSKFFGLLTQNVSVLIGWEKKKAQKSSTGPISSPGV
jgi:hypothetical protein